jgi:hypothetical protein
MFFGSLESESQIRLGQYRLPENMTGKLRYLFPFFYRPLGERLKLILILIV